MKQINLPPLMRGIDVKASESGLDGKSVRDAVNVVLEDDGGASRRPAHGDPGLEHAGAHSLWKNRAGTRTLYASGDTLYEFSHTTWTGTPRFSGLPVDEPVSYDEIPGAIVFTCGGVLGKLCADGAVRRPGVANLLGNKPIVLPTMGGLYPGVYQVAYTLVNDLGEESAPSSPAEIELPNGGGITVMGMGTASDVEKMRIYVSPPGGAELYLHAELSAAGTASITDQHKGPLLRFAGDIAMPGGQIVRNGKGRMLVASGPTVLASEALNYGLHDPRAGWISQRRRVALMEQVEAGLFVGTADGVVFYAGDGPADWKPQATHPFPPVPGTGRLVPPDLFDPRLVPDRGSPVAVWLSNVGLVIGRADGSVVAPQSDRMTLEAAGVGSPAFIQQKGLSQLVFLVESMTIGANGAPDSTL